MANTNRPLKYGPGDRREVISTDGEVSVRIVNDANANPIYIGRARCGSSESFEVWQVSKLAYDANNGLVSMKWPENSLGAASTEYEFAWNSASSATITNITQANPGVVTTSAAHGYLAGDVITISNVTGMTEVNFDNTTDTVFVVGSPSPTTFELLDIDGDNVDTTAYTAYAGSGTVTAQNWANYTYS